MWCNYILSILLYLAILTGKENLYTYDDNRNLCDVGFPVWLYIVGIVALFIPIINVGFGIMCFMRLCIKISEGIEYPTSYNTYHVKTGKKNWIATMWRLLNKRV